MPGGLAKRWEGPNETHDSVRPSIALGELIRALVWLIAIAIALLVWRAANR